MNNKKKYVVPDLYYENFELSQHVATCAWDMANSKSKDDCYAEWDSSMSDGETLGVTLFNAKNCDFSGTEYEDYCWTNGEGNMAVFNS